MSHSPVRFGLYMFLPLALVAGSAQAADKQPTSPAPAAAGQLLEFMADWQGDDGQWTDPLTFAQIDPARLKAEEVRRRAKPLPSAASKTAPAAGTAAR